MDKIEAAFVAISQSAFHFLEADFGFVRHGAKHETVNAASRIAIPYDKPGVFVRPVFHSGAVSIEIGGVANEPTTPSPTYWSPETLSKAFTLYDLVEFRNQGQQSSLLDFPSITEDNMDSILKTCASALEKHGADILRGDISVLADLEIINKRKADRFLP